MTRIIAGTFGGRRIAVPPKGTRPTSDRVREALFSRLDHSNLLRGAHVLDLFAGSGGLGLEALSRGAAEATFVEANSSAARVLQSNIRELGVGTSATLVRERVQPYLQRGGPSTKADLVFADPPYDIPRGEMADMLAALKPALASAAVVVVEWSTRAPLPDWPHFLVPVARKEYGETVLHYAEFDKPAEFDEPAE
ncbi:16S rRNA (guanine(966)-N(2))-methyltransferase RsmD [Demequina aurantiaca]|uniref:16S rRNA (guanine(966)-N(2))-methyltransferase RsmD n=1 Tax=Demequina aurantiaca TaxID=676200 RepID=UPI000782B021|nr:16S rRNA (guanine(966)-N(2))-methyltransferase RsmD [Demequina aurantiaca]